MALGLSGRMGGVVKGRAGVWAVAVAGLGVLLMSGCGSTVTAASQATVTLSPTTLSFGNVFTGLSSAAGQTVTVTNRGTAAVTITSLTATGDFVIGPSAGQCNAGTALTANTYCLVDVFFSPTAAGVRTGTLTVVTSAASNPAPVTLTGMGVAGTPALTLTPTALNFGAVGTGLQSSAQLVVATNSGTAALNISGIAVSGDFAEASNGCGVALAANANCTVLVTFKPTAAGTRTGTLSFTSNASGTSPTVALTGTGQMTGLYAGAPFTVTVEAGTTPIAGASVQLYAVGSSGNASPGSALLPAPLTTNAMGVVTVSPGYNCFSSASPVYLLAQGGTVTGASGANSNTMLMTALGPCGGLATAAKFVVNEATSVAAVEGLAQFYGAGGSVGASATNLTGITNAFTVAAELADPGAGTSPGSALPGNATSPAARMNSLANVLNACVVAASKCNALYSLTPNGATSPTNTLDAAFYLAKHPTANVAALYTLSLSSMAYAPALTVAPTDWTMFMTYSGGGLNSPSGIGVDSKGGVWVASYNSAATKLLPSGAVTFSAVNADGLNNSYGLAIDLADNVWISNEQPFQSNGDIGSVTELSSAGALISGSPYINGGLDYPLGMAIDPNGTVWVVDFGNSYLTLLSATGVPLSGVNGYTTPLFAFPVAVAIDANHFGWIADQSSNAVTKVAPDGSSFTNYTCCNAASGIAIDQANDVWVANYFGDSISLLTNAGVVIGSNYTGLGSIYHPQGIAVDGAGTVWVANYRAPYLTELSGSASAVPGTSLSPAAGLGGDAKLLTPYALALDASGSIWISNQGSSTVTRYVGLAVPVKTPLSGLPQLP